MEDFCLSLNHDYLTRYEGGSGPENLFLPKWLIEDKDAIGIYANANPDKHADWVNITSDIDSLNFIGKSRAWNPAQKRCDGIMTTLQYHLFWTYDGSLHNPQAKIIRCVTIHLDSLPSIINFFIRIL